MGVLMWVYGCGCRELSVGRWVYGGGCMEVVFSLYVLLF